jgi:hypothetical protein
VVAQDKEQESAFLGPGALDLTRGGEFVRGGGGTRVVAGRVGD